MRKILIQLDTDPLPSVFDRVVAVDADVEELFSYGGVTPENVEGLIHGAMFTRGPADLKNTAVFIGGSKVGAGEALFERVGQVFFGPIRVSVMMDSNGSNTTAAAAVKVAGQHLKLSDVRATVLGGTGPVGHRAAQLLALQGAQVTLVSRSLERAEETCHVIRQAVPHAKLTAAGAKTADETQKASQDSELLIAAGAAGVCLLTEEQWSACGKLRVAIDLNAVPPLGLGGIEMQDKAVERKNVICYGALGVGGTKMKLHKACIRKLFESNSQWLGTESIFKVAQDLG
ncbi:MAG: NADP-dependent methylenetetrahydromethanopterin/methylenetetrahydrofolate dehydrogenase [Planctomycetales bacterium]